jgi:23S rRNA (uracil1939-C5)-methyltransferase
MDREKHAREDDLCPHFGICGSCTLLDLRYAEQLERKRGLLFETLRDVAVTIPPVIGDARPFQYRNKAIYPFGLHRGEAVAGFYRRGSHELVDVHSCRVQDPALTALASEIRTAVRRLGIPIYDERTHRGVLRALHLRVAPGTGQVMVGFVINGRSLPHEVELVQAVLAAALPATREGLPPKIVSIMRNLNEAVTNVVLGPENEVVHGQSFLTERLGGLELRLSLPSFYQVNASQAARAYDLVRELARRARCDRIVDAYAGIGTIALWLAREAREVIGIEESSAAVVDAQRNAARNEVANVTFRVGRAEEQLGQLEPPVGSIILDPPRAGCTRAVLEHVARLAPERVIYLSCAPRTLARDLRILGQSGLVVEALQPIDFFPHTDHVEVVAALARR